jgi:ADP-heptose:LPS heptosyltransferase
MATELPANVPAADRALPARWYVMRAVDLLARLRRPPRQRRGALVVIGASGLGDVTLAHFAIDRYPELLDLAPADITIVAGESAQGLASLVFPGMEFRLVDDIAFHRNPIYRLRFLLWLRARGFDVAICGTYMRKPMVCDALVEASGARRRIVVSPYMTEKTRRIFRGYLRRCPEVVATGEYPTSELLRYSRLASAVAHRDVKLTPPLLAWTRSPASGLPERYAVVAAGASGPEKCWPLENFIAVAKFLEEHGLRPVFIGGDTDRALKRALASRDPEGRFIDRIGNISLSGLFDILTGAALVVANDTGPAHIAAALARPIVVILGGGHFGANFPYPPEATPPFMRVVHRDMPCFHCHWHCTQPHVPGGPVPCIEGVGVDEVIRAAEHCLAAAAEQIERAGERVA